MTKSPKLKYTLRALLRGTITPHQQIYYQALRDAERGSSTEKSPLESAFDLQAKALGMDGFAVNYRFHPSRKWELDRADVKRRLGIEIQGGIYGKPVFCPNCHLPVKRLNKAGNWVPVREGTGHSSGHGIQRDYDKFNAAQMLGWMVILLSAEMIENGTGIELVRQARGLRPNFPES